MRRLLVLVCAVVFVETAFYSVITPLLPELSVEYDLSKAHVGMLAAAYAAGTLAGAIPGGWLVARAGVRTAVVAGLGLMAASSLAFAFAHSVAMLDVTRFAQGVGGAACWTGALGWIVREAPADRRGAAIGAAMAMATVGALFGPVLGGLASAVGTAGVFCTVAGIGVVLMGWAALTPSPRPGGHAHFGALLAAVRDRRVATGLWLMLIPGLLFGTIYVLAPLRLDALGAGATVIAGLFLAAAAIEAFVSPLSGRLTDRRGRVLPALTGLAGGALAMAVLPWPTTAWLLGIVLVLGAPMIGFLWTPAITLVGDGADAVGVEPGFAFALSNLAWALGQTVGSSGSAALAQAFDDRLPYLGLAALAVATLGVLWRAGPARLEPAPAASLSRS
jgi:MFS family permease